MSERVYTTERTGKGYKGAMLIFGLMLVLGIVIAVATQDAIGGLMVLVGAVGYLLARIGAWWNHG